MKNKIIVTGRTLMDNSLIREFIEETNLSGRFDNIRSNFSFNDNVFKKELFEKEFKERNIDADFKFV